MYTITIVDPASDPILLPSAKNSHCPEQSINPIPSSYIQLSHQSSPFVASYELQGDAGDIVSRVRTPPPLKKMGLLD